MFSIYVNFAEMGTISRHVVQIIVEVVVLVLDKRSLCKILLTAIMYKEFKLESPWN